MRTIQEIKDEVAISSAPLVIKKWGDLTDEAKVQLFDFVLERAQLEACKATLEKAADNAESFLDIEDQPRVSSGSITSESNIVIIK